MEGLNKRGQVAGDRLQGRQHPFACKQKRDREQRQFTGKTTRGFPVASSLSPVTCSIGAGGCGSECVCTRDRCSRCGRGSLVARSWMVVKSEQQVVPNLEHFAQHLERSAHYVEAAAVVVDRFHTYFLHDEAEAIREHEHFRIEAPALDALAGENQPGSPALQGFETALGIFKTQSQNGTDHHLESSAADTAVPGSCDPFSSGNHSAGSDGDVGAFMKGGEQLVAFLNWDREIGVAEQDDL